VHLDDALRYGEPQASTSFLPGDGIIGLLELLKKPRACTHKSGSVISRVEVRFTPEATQLLRGSELTLWANCGLMQCSKEHPHSIT
jgi:hypothetical protein